jgi:uncharacterized protein YggL (DUF469 family)
MKKRLRKKNHLRDFARYGRQLIVNRHRKDGFDEFLYAFVEEAIEQSGCYCGSGGKEDILDVVVELGTRPENPEAKLDKVTAQIGARPDVKNWQVGEEFDLWHGDLVEAQEESQQVNQDEGG